MSVFHFLIFQHLLGSLQSNLLPVSTTVGNSFLCFLPGEVLLLKGHIHLFDGRNPQHPEEGFFIAGMKSYGRAPTFLLATGYEQVRSIAAHLAGGDATPRALNLPETGVCSAAGPAPEEELQADRLPEEAGCCAPGPEPVTLGVPTGLLHGRGGA